MAKEIKTILKLQIPAGQANPASFRLLGTLKKPLDFLRRPALLLMVNFKVSILKFFNNIRDLFLNLMFIIKLQKGGTPIFLHGKTPVFPAYRQAGRPPFTHQYAYWVN